MNSKFFVPYQTARQLKEKGYPQDKSDYGYFDNGDSHPIIMFPADNFDCAAPTYHEVVDWLEREKEIYITTYRVVMAYVVETPQGTIKEKLGWKGCAEVPSGAEEDTDTFITREEALNAGILKALEMV